MQWSLCVSLHLSEQDFAERDIQALKEAVQLTRPEAIQALKHTHGDVNAALVNELAAMGHRVSIVDDLVHSYAFQRPVNLPVHLSFLWLHNLAHWGSKGHISQSAATGLCSHP
jgi:hypothetical protein